MNFEETSPSLERGISYNIQPSSYSRSGQKSSEVIDLRDNNLAKSGTELDTESLKASCLDSPLQNHFFGPDNETAPERKKRERIAISICMMCPVRTTCLENSITEQFPYGVWGGLGEKDRMRLLMKSNAPLKSHSF